MRYFERTPVIVLGAARAGTTLLGKMLAMHPEVIYVEEPQVIWRYRNVRVPTDVIPEERATPEVVSYIRARFLKLLEGDTSRVLVEKTPSNSLRPFFVQKVLPEAKFIHLVRDGRAVALSAAKKWEREEDANAKRLSNEDQKFRLLQKQLQKAASMPARDIIHYLAPAADSLLFQAGLRKRKTWGPKFPGIGHLARTHSLYEVCAMQWKSSVETVRNFQRYIDDSRFFELHYEDLIRNPEEKVQEVLGFAELDCQKDLERLASVVMDRVDYGTDWREVLSAEEQEKVEKLIGVTLEDLGYL